MIMGQKGTPTAPFSRNRPGWTSPHLPPLMMSKEKAGGISASGNPASKNTRVWRKGGIDGCIDRLAGGHIETVGRHRPRRINGEGRGRGDHKGVGEAKGERGGGGTPDNATGTTQGCTGIEISTATKGYRRFRVFVGMRMLVNNKTRRENQIKL